ncbi:MAG: DUF934 domain-containing protein [Gammaproteobacteria bacterium]|nr:DUF934 domain-containing protein [Gammaproteobacteria bacterium]
MPVLIKQTNQAKGDWSIAPLDQPNWKSSDTWSTGTPLILQVDEEPISAYVEASAIAIEFPAFSDGRGLSLGVLLRSRFEFTGELRAVGAVHEDVLHYMVRCGFDSFELGDDRDANIALAQIAPYSDHYQASVVNPEPAFRRVNRGHNA